MLSKQAIICTLYCSSCSFVIDVNGLKEFDMIEATNLVEGEYSLDEILSTKVVFHK